MKASFKITLLVVLPVIAMGGALWLASDQVHTSDTFRTRNVEIADRMARSAHTVLSLRRSYFGLLRYGMDRNPGWLKPFQDAKATIPALLSDVDEICTTSRQRSKGRDFALSLATVVGLAEEIIWIAPMSPHDLCPIRLRQLRFALQANLKELNNEQIALTDLHAQEGAHPFTFHVRFALLFAVALTGTCAVLAAQAIRKKLWDELSIAQAAVRTKIRARAASGTSAATYRHRAATLDAREAEILESLDGLVFLLKQDGKILQCNAKAKTFLERLGNPEFLFADQLKDAGTIVNIDRVCLPSGLVLCKVWV